MFWIIIKYLSNFWLADKTFFCPTVQVLKGTRALPNYTQLSLFKHTNYTDMSK